MRGAATSFRHVPCADRVEFAQKLASSIPVQAEEEAVARGEVELGHVEERVMQARQSIEGEHADHAGERGDEYRQLESYRDELGPAVGRDRLSPREHAARATAPPLRQGAPELVGDGVTQGRSRAQKVTIVAHDVGIVGGMERILAELALGLKRRGHDVTVIARSCDLPASSGVRLSRATT